MSRRPSSLCLLLTGLCLLHPVCAHEFIGEFATIHVKASAGEAPCWLKLTSQDQSVALPPVSSWQLRKPGMHSAEVFFHMEMHGCLPEPGKRTDLLTGLITGSPDSPVVSTLFNGAQDADNPALFAVRGAGGVGLEISDIHGKAVIPGLASTPQIIPTINNVLDWQVALVRTAAPLVAGPVQATIEFRVIYD
ncbi:type 1 fimbrial protein [Enterobacteriaceae bacterium 89]|nr:type 1 fimbrial protein [Enterobacteriaceae bacterium 89]